MNKLLIALSVVVALGVAGAIAMNTPQNAHADTLVAEAAEQTQSFAIENMTCATCPITVRKAMERVDGVQSVKVDYDTKTAVVVFDPAITTAKAIGDASTGVGYPAKPSSK